MTLRIHTIAAILLAPFCAVTACADRELPLEPKAQAAQSKPEPAAVPLRLVAAETTAATTAAQPTKDITFDDIKLELKKGDPYDSSLLTDKIKQLEGRSIRVRGFILPSFQQNDIKQFVLVRDNMECCFGPGALLHDCILVEMVGAASASFTVRPISVLGTFSVRELKGPDGKILAIYHLDGKEVK